MRKIKSILLSFLFVSTIAFGQNLNSEKEIDNSEFMVSQKSASQSGSLDNTDPTFGRVFGDDYSITCSASSSLSGAGSNVFYDVYEISTTVDEAAIVSISSNGLADSHMTLYCSFDPNNPQANIVCIDDDGAGGLMSAFTPADNYLINANTTYYLVVTSFGSGETGGYTVDLGGNLQFAAVAAVPLSNWAFALIGLFAIGFVFIRIRK